MHLHFVQRDLAALRGNESSAIPYLDRLPLDILKIDKSFVSELDQRPDRAATTALIVRLARLFGLETIAEGVERPQELGVLRTLDCDIAQGFYLARPLSCQVVTELLQARAQAGNEVLGEVREAG